MKESVPHVDEGVPLIPPDIVVVHGVVVVVVVGLHPAAVVDLVLAISIDKHFGASSPVFVTLEVACNDYNVDGDHFQDQEQCCYYCFFLFSIDTKSDI